MQRQNRLWTVDLSDSWKTKIDLEDRRHSERPSFLHESVARRFECQASSEHSVYSPDVAASDYGLLRSTHHLLNGHRFELFDEGEACQELSDLKEPGGSSSKSEIF
ncbi:hypothetical protein KIN20_028634 [Parelaphostrongylus tenuis]|uniref:Uncharacterized protein n=1 Tax=Parelaphostrongylus tenuis TaxID=148309 RepID=A0AAD5R1F9_PARTN|nr:hypothetical protein KIN20_028620 [Parelaphostrongylus tenuis]KAJ1367677.1 hypothetical protein KIN20_028634 [Parelaphostrongylus tenuis]